MSHVLGVYWAPGHQRPADIDYMRQLQPPAVRVLDPGAEQLAIAHRAAPNALLLPRDWALSEQHDDVRRDPVGTGKRHAQDWRGKINRWRGEGAQLPPDNQIVVVGVNEPQVWNMLPQTVEYNVAFLDECKRLGLRACALNLSVGWPANTGPDTPPDWNPYTPIEAAIKRGNHFLTIHEYWYHSGPTNGATWWAWRHRSCPWDVPIIIGECGVDCYVDKARWDNEGGNRGWRGHMPPQQYAAQIGQYARGCDPRVKAILPFLTDYRSNMWESFDTLEAHGSLIASRETFVPQSKPVETRLPHIESSPKPAQPPQTPAVPSLTHPVTNPAFRTITQPYGVNGDYYSRFKVDGVALKGHNGIDFGTPIGTLIAAVDGGRVVEVADDPEGYGLYVKLSHAWGESLYAHLRDPLVQVGEWANKGQYVGKSGNSGNSTGPHLHFGLRVAPFNRQDGWGGFTDPAPYLRQEGTPLPIITRDQLLTFIKTAAQEFGIEWTLLASLAWAESSFNPAAQSTAGAKGVMQIMPATWAEWATKVGASDPLNPRDSLRVGAAYLRWLLDTLDGNTYKALLAYNFGVGSILANITPPPATLLFAAKIVHGRDLLKAVG